MDKQLLKALDNLSVGLEALAEALKDKNAQSGTGQALQSGNFENSLQSITVELKSIKKDTQEILKNQQTILAMQKKKDSDKKTADVEEAGGAKKESALKKGVATILLIAVAVLAIGMAFKLVGKINFLSVIGLAAAIFIISLAFERISKLNLSIKQAAITSLVLVMMAAAVTISSYILAKVQKVGIMQLVTTGAILAMFALAAPRLVEAMEALGSMGIMKLIKSIVALPVVMIAVAYGVAESSKVLRRIVPIGFTQALTAIFIAGMFTVIAYGLPKLMDAVGKISLWNVLTGKVPKLALVMAAVAIGVTEASRYMQRIKPLSFSQAMTGILIAGMFTVVSYGIYKITQAVGNIKWADMLKLPTMLALMATGIAISAFIFYKAKMYIDGIGFITSLRILLLGVTIGAIAIVVAFAIKILGNAKWDAVLKIPALFTLMATGIAASAFILAKAVPSLDKLGFMTILKILFLGASLAVITLIVAFVSKILGVVAWSQVLKIPVFFTLVSTAVAASAWIMSKAVPAFDKMTPAMLIKMLVFGIIAAVVIAVFALVIKLFNILGIGVKDAVKGGLAIVAIAGVVMLSSLILNLGKYKNYPSLKWILGVGASLAAFGLAAILLGTQAMNPFFYAGLGLTLLLAGTIIATSLILAQGSYKKYPTIKWLLGVSASMGLFAGAAILLGFNALNPFFYAGLGIICLIAETIVEVSDILKQGKYNLPGLGTWAASVALLYTLFTPLIITLGAVGAAAAVMEFFGGGNPFEAGRGMLKDIAWSIVDVSKILQKGVWKQGPTKEWAEGVSIALGAFAPVYKMLVDSAIFEAFGMSGIGPDEFAKGIKTVALGITAAAWYFAKNKSAFLNGPPVKWAKGVSLAIGGFAPVFKVMEDFPFTGGQKIARAMVHVAHAIVNVAEILSAAGGAGLYKKGTYPSKKWGQGVGEAIGAFSKVFDYMFENSSGWFDDDAEEVIDQMRYGMRQIAYGITDVAWALNGTKFEDYPSKTWGTGIKNGIESFIEIFNMIWDSGLSTYEFRDLSGRVASGAAAMAMTANVLYRNRKAFSVKLDPNFIKNISTNIIGFAKLALMLDKLLVTEKTVTTTSEGVLGMGGSKSTKTVKERRDLSLAKDVARQMASVAVIFYFNRKFFDSKVAQNVKRFGNTIFNPKTGSIMQYAKLNRALELMEQKSLSKSLSKMTLKSLLNDGPPSDSISDMARRMVQSASILYSNKKVFDIKVITDVVRWVKLLTTSIMGFVALNKWLKANLYQKVTTTYGFKSKWLGNFSFKSTSYEMMDLSLVPMMAEKIVDTAMILNKGNFNQKIDPYYIRRVGQNMIDFAHVIKVLARKEGGLLGGIGSSISSLFGMDPISQVARRMVTLAKGYDAIASALLKLGFALRTLNIKNLSQLGSITKGLTDPSSSTEVKSERPKRLRTLYGDSPDERPGGKKEKKKVLSGELQKKNEIYYVSQQLEKVVKLLQSIDRSTSTIDEFIALQTGNKIMSPPPLQP